MRKKFSLYSEEK